MAEKESICLKTAEGRVLVYDKTKNELCLSANGKECFRLPVREIFRCSSGIPWSFKPGEEFPEAEGDLQTLCLRFRFSFGTGSLTFRFAGEELKGTLHLDFTQEAPDFFAGLFFRVPGNSVFTIPGNLYNNNPSTSSDRLVPRFPSQGETSLLLEESRVPLPGVSAEYGNSACALFSLSDFQKNAPERTLGLLREAAGDTCLVLTSGALSFNGGKDMFYALKLQTAPVPEPYCSYRKGGELELLFALRWSSGVVPGHGFRELAAGAFSLFSPQPNPALPLERVIELKQTALQERWAAHGYTSTAPDNLFRRKPQFLFGWTGQSFRLALCDLRNAVRRGETAGIHRCMECIRFFLEGSKTALPGLHCNRYNLWEDTWTADLAPDGQRGFSSRALGETWSDLARILLFAREHQLETPEGAYETLKQGCRFFLDHLLAQGVPPIQWHDDGSAVSQETSCAGSSILPGLFDLWQLSGEESWKAAALEMLEHFWLIGGNDFRTPFSHATLDAKCEDKEAGIPFFIAAAKAWKLTGCEKYRHYAEVSGDWLLTWVCFRDLPLRPGTICAQKGFRTCGWPVVSIENQHLDVFFPAWELYEFGKAAGIQRFLRLGQVVFAAWSYGISQGGGDWMFQNPGRQCEQFMHTNWNFSRSSRMPDWPELFLYYFRQWGCTAENIDTHCYKGGAIPWDVAWIIALVLDAAQNFAAEKFSE